jgi:hypothetical protein
MSKVAELKKQETEIDTKMEGNTQMTKVTPELKKENHNVETSVTDAVEFAHELATFATAANENRAGFGTRLAFNKGRFICGKDKQTLALGTHLVAVMREVRHGYIKWGGGRIVGAAVGRVVDGFKPNRNALDERDENLWPVSNISGKQDDPWQKTIYIPMITLDGATVYTFQTHSFYGREAAYLLLHQYSAQGADHPGQYPVIELGSTISKSSKYGDVPSPTFNIVDWLGRPQLALPDSSIKTVVEEETEPEKPAPDFDDEMPF